MESEVQRRQKTNLDRYSKEAFHLAAQFAKAISKEMRDAIKAVVLFGSATRRGRKPHDVDVLVIIDDVNLHLTKEMVHTYRLIVQKLIGEISTKLHVTSLKFTSFWEYLRVGDPIAINMLREGYALIDTNLFTPMQRLLQQGRIRPTPEAVWTYHQKSQATLANAGWHVMHAVIDLYWAAVDAAHAALMAVGEAPPGPEQMPQLLEERLVKAGLLKSRQASLLKELYDLQKGLVRGHRKELSGQEYDRLFAETESFLKAIERVVKGSQ